MQIRFIALVVLFAAFIPFTSFAQGGDGVDAARDAFWEGNHDYANERFEEAIEHFEHAYALSDNARLLDYIGRCYANLGDLTAAIDWYERFGETSVDARTEAIPIIENLETERLRLVVQHTMTRVEDAATRALGEQPAPRDQRRRSLGTNMRDVVVMITSAPRGAHVSIDGMPFGDDALTPFDTPLFVGQRLIEVSREFYAPQARVVSVTPPGSGESIPSFVFELERLEVEVSATVSPVTASMTFVGEDGVMRQLGLGGFSGTLPAGPGTFILQQGGRDRRIEVVLRPADEGTPVELELHLEDPALSTQQMVRIGTLTVRSEELFGDVYIDGGYVGGSPGSFSEQVTPGEHTVELRREGYATGVQSVEITADAETVIVTRPLTQLRRGTAAVGWTVMGVGIAAAGAGVGTMLADEVDTLSLALMAGGGALAVTGLTWGIVASSKANQRNARAESPRWYAGALPQRGGGFFTLGGAF
ncbi:MAG: hypothetical protein ACI81R_000467 [Bradymonadia bacterium]|jgi:hypothetical protein